MDDIKMPDLINTPDKPVNPRIDYKSKYIGEYSKDAEKLLIKTNIMTIISLIDDCEPLELSKFMGVLKNIIILHGKTIITMPNLINTIQRAINIHPLCYDIYVIHKLLDNVTNSRCCDNIHFRFVNENISKYPPMSVEDMCVLENKLKNMRYSYQARKKHIAFKVGQIVGAKDKENKWWLSRILHVYNDEERSGFWYYVRFEGWGNVHDEWINSETYRVGKFNSRKHHLKR